MAEGVDGLLRDKTRPPGVAPLAPAVVDKVVALTLEPPVHEATHWTVRAMAKAVGIAASSVVRIWHDQGLAPHRAHRPVRRLVDGRLQGQRDDLVHYRGSKRCDARL